mmetsp:Transcript_78831/g.156125  ORF Transcript_78831/g.156125 Transcript_78831/m.156125 type:complete len:232 (+) Transcript_78831:1702-2397(+)
MTLLALQSFSCNFEFSRLTSSISRSRRITVLFGSSAARGPVLAESMGNSMLAPPRPGVAAACPTWPAPPLAPPPAPPPPDRASRGDRGIATVAELLRGLAFLSSAFGGEEAVRCPLRTVREQVRTRVDASAFFRCVGCDCVASRRLGEPSCFEGPRSLGSAQRGVTAASSCCVPTCFDVGSCGHTVGFSISAASVSTLLGYIGVAASDELIPIVSGALACRCTSCGICPKT